MTRPILALTLAAAALAGGSASAQPAPQTAAEAWRATTLNLSASGEVQADPDMATISVGVQTQGATAAEAMADNARQMDQLMGALRRQGVQPRDTQTSGLSLSPQYAYAPSSPPRLNGYQADNQVTVIVNDLGRLGPTLDAVVSAGANQVHGVSFGLKDAKAAEDAARLKAVQALQAKAQLYAAATGYRVVRLVSLSEGAPFPAPRPVVFAARAPAIGALPAPPIEAGALKIQAEVSATYELAR